jgi:2-polyprenyl-3-methyl-5-hydroxy-6-metoxy-1,4-benzoquinol methylase
MSERQEILDNARYLRNVRPVSPEEIHEYVSTRPHPAVVRRTLREAAFDLGMREREDGSFVPVEEGPLSVEFCGVDRFPERYAHRLEDELVSEYGAGWPSGESGEQLRARIRELKESYFDERAVEYDRETALAYALYHLPDYYAAVQYPLADLGRAGLLPSKLRVLEVGAGVGGPALGVHDLLDDESLVDYHAIEPSPAADLFETMLGDTRPSFRTTVHRERAEAFDPDSVGEFDLVLFTNVLSELDDPEAVARRYADSLSAEGSMLLLAPADRNTATGLRSVERTLADDGPMTVYAPTVRLWPGKRPTDRGWSFDVEPDLAVPPFQERLDGAGEDDGTYVNVDVQYAYATLRHDDETAVSIRPDPDRHARMADMERHVTRRVDLLALKLSHDLSEGGNPLFKVSDSSESTEHYAVRTKPSALNEALVSAGYGDPLYFQNVLVLWNDDEGAYNLVVDGETVVDRAGGG